MMIMHQTILYVIMGFVVIGFFVQAFIGITVAKSVFGRKNNESGSFLKNYIDGKVLEKHYKINRVKD
jgi:hypothetical protein